MRQLFDFRQHVVGNGLIHLQQRYRSPPRLGAPKIERGDIHLRVAEHHSKGTNVARLVQVLGIEHVRSELSLHVNVPDSNEPWSTVREDRTGNGPLLALGLNTQ